MFVVVVLSCLVLSPISTFSIEQSCKNGFKFGSHVQSHVQVMCKSCASRVQVMSKSWQFSHRLGDWTVFSLVVLQFLWSDDLTFGKFSKSLVWSTRKYPSETKMLANKSCYICFSSDKTAFGVTPWSPRSWGHSKWPLGVNPKLYRIEKNYLQKLLGMLQ